MDATLLLQFWIVAALLVVTPGADWAYAISAGLTARSVVPSIVGILAGYAIVIAAVAVGVGALVARYPVALAALTVAGGLYLLYLGVTTLIRRTEPGIAAGPSPATTALAQFVRGAGVSGINPKGLLLLLALLPQFISPEGWPASGQMLALGAVHLLNCAVVYVTVALLARRLLRSRPRAGVVVTKFAGAAMVVIGMLLLGERIAELF